MPESRASGESLNTDDQETKIKVTSIVFVWSEADIEEGLKGLAKIIRFPK